MKSKIALLRLIFIAAILILSFILYSSREINGLAFGIIFILVMLNVNVTD